MGYLSTARTTLKKTRGKGYGWLASRSGSKYEKNRHIAAKDVVGLLGGDSKNNESLTKMKTY